MADFGTCAVDWPLMDEWEEELALDWIFEGPRVVGGFEFSPGNSNDPTLTSLQEALRLLDHIFESLAFDELVTWQPSPGA